jgi:phosphoribosylanthranilate isomerase
VPALVSRVGVFVDASPAEVADAVRIACLDVVQLHGDEPIDAYDSVGARVIKVTSLADDAEVARVVAWPAAVTPLVDAADPVQRGGTGRKADWSAAAAVAAQRSIVLAGGLTAANVADAIAHVRPWGLDVSSGVEDAPGIKSAAKLRAFFAALTAAVEREVM